MNKSSAIITIVLIIFITLPIFFITVPILFYMYNSLIKKNNHVEFAYSSIDVMLKKRSDLIPNVVSSVNKIMTHEKELFESITRLRSNIQENYDSKEKRFSLENEMSQLLGQIQVTMENYPEIKSNENMMHLQRTLNEVEEQIGASRRAYNSSVIIFNNSIQTIPTNIVAALSEYRPKTYFEAQETSKINPSVKNLFGT